MIHRTSSVTGLLLAAALLAVAVPAHAQTLRGVVVDSLSQRPISGAGVSWEGPSGVTTVQTDQRGRFVLEVEGAPPWTLGVSQLGYHQSRVEVHDAADGVLVRISPRPLAVAGVSGQGEAEEPDFRFTARYVTNGGLVGRPDLYGCTWPVIDSVVVKDIALLRPEIVEAYERSSLWWGATAIVHRMLEHLAYDSRLRRDAWPCAVTWVQKHRRWDRFRELPTPPDPEGVPVTLQAAFEFDAPELARCPGSTAVAPDGRVALASRTGTVRVLDDSGDDLWSRPAPHSDPPPCPVRVGWRGDTLWVIDRAADRITLYPELADDAAIERGGEPAHRGWQPPDRVMPDLPTRLDLPVPIPVAGDRWLWTFPAQDPPTPPIHPDDPPGRLLVTLDDEWAPEGVVFELRPGPRIVDLELGPRPEISTEPFGDHPLWALSPDGEHVTIVEREHQMAAWITIYRITRIDLTGDTIFSHERRASMIRLDDEMFERAVAALGSLPGSVAAFPGPPLGREALIAAMIYRPPFIPSVSDLFVDPEGNTWIRWPDRWDDTVRWEVVDPGGTSRRTFTADRDLELFAADGDVVWGRRFGPDGTRIEKLEIREGG